LYGVPILKIYILFRVKPSKKISFYINITELSVLGVPNMFAPRPVDPLPPLPCSHLALWIFFSNF